jgi:3-oxoacyl-[acyl-carrier-protein] synthase-3
MGSEIIAAGHYAPARRVPNAAIEEQLGLEAGWIERRTGIRERRWAADGEALTDIALEAGRMALSRAGLAPRRVALTILATSTPDHLLPPSAPLLAHRLGLPASGAIDMAGACAGFLYALALADSFVAARGCVVLVVAANILSRRIDPQDRASSVLFADAAGAVLLAPSTRRRAGVLGVKLASDGAAYDLIKIEAGGSRKPFHPGLAPAETLMRISDGAAVFTKAVAMMADSSRAALEEARLAVADVTHWIPHQANHRIIEAARKQIGIDPARVLSTVETFGNSSAASIPFTLSHAAETRSYAPGDVLLLSAAGAGLTGGALVFGL